MFFRDKPYMNLLLFPFYYLCGYSIFVARAFSLSKKGPLFSLYLFVCCSLTLIPASLLEPRYFNVPVIITLLELPSPQSYFDYSVVAEEAMRLIPWKSNDNSHSLQGGAGRRPKKNNNGNRKDVINSLLNIDRETFGFSQGLVFIVFLLANITTIYIFLFKTFSDNNGVQRFMW